MVICLEWGADLHMAQLMPLPLTVSRFIKIRNGLPFWYRLTWVVPEKGPLNGCVCVYYKWYLLIIGVRGCIAAELQGKLWRQSNRTIVELLVKVQRFLQVSCLLIRVLNNSYTVSHKQQQVGMWWSQLKSASIGFTFSVSNPSDLDANLPHNYSLFHWIAIYRCLYYTKHQIRQHIPVTLIV